VGLVSQVATDNPLAALLRRSVDRERVGAPVDRRLLLYAVGASLSALACAVVGRFWALEMGPGGWVGSSVVQWGELWSYRLATPVGGLALGGLALDCVLASGLRVGEWARWACVAQAALTLAAVPLLVVVGVVVLNIVIGIALVLLVLAILLGALGS
jgi:hypothetical protein